MPFESSKERKYWESFFRDRGYILCGICGKEVIWDRKIAPPHGKAGTASDLAANIDHIISDKDECKNRGIEYSSQENLRVTHRKCNYRKNKHGDKPRVSHKDIRNIIG